VKGIFLKFLKASEDFTWQEEIFRDKWQWWKRKAQKPILWVKHFLFGLTLSGLIVSHTLPTGNYETNHEIDCGIFFSFFQCVFYSHSNTQQAVTVFLYEWLHRWMHLIGDRGPTNIKGPFGFIKESERKENYENRWINLD
jgi:hypothetical protein